MVHRKNLKGLDSARRRKMSQETIELIAAAFQDESGAENALEGLVARDSERAHGIRNSIVIQRDANNTLRIRENVSAVEPQAIAAGAVLGGSIGLLFPPNILCGSVLGATIVGLAARLRDNGFPETRLNELGASLLPGTSALLALVSPRDGADLEREFAAQGAQVARETISAELAAKLEQSVEALRPVMAVTDTRLSHLSEIQVGARASTQTASAAPEPSAQSTDAEQSASSATNSGAVTTMAPTSVEPKKEAVQATNGERAAARSLDSNSIHKE